MALSDAPPVADGALAVAEGRRLGSYLLGYEPSAAVLDRYASSAARAHVGSPADAFDEFLVRWARVGAFLARGADFYARLVRPNALLRRKLICLLALAEVSAADAHVVGRVDPDAGPAWFVARLGVRGLASAAALVISLPVLVPAHVILRRRTPWRS